MKQRNLSIILLLLLLCLISRLINFAGIGINDDIAYIQTAQNLEERNHLYRDQRAFRLGMIFPLVLLYKVFGYNELGFSLYPLICSLTTCLLIYLTAARLWGTGAAIVASLLWIAYPLQIVFDTQLSPSNQHATCVAAALFLYFYSTTDKTSLSHSALLPSSEQALPKASISRFNVLSKLREPVLLILCGVFLGLGWWINELFVTFILVVIPFLFLVRPRIKHLFWIIIGFLFTVFFELSMVKNLSGSWLARFNIILETEAFITSNKEYDYLPRTLFKIWDMNPLYDEGHFGIIWYLFIIVTILALLLKKKLPLALALGCWLWLAYLQWGVQAPDGTPIAKYIRYISMAVPIQCLVFGAIFGHLLKFSRKLKPVLILLFVLLLIHLSWLGTKAVNTVKIRTEDFKEIAKYLVNLKLKNNDIVYTDRYSADFVELYSKGRLNIKKIDRFKWMANPPQKGYIVKDSSRILVELPEYRRGLPEWYLTPPAHWPLLYTVHGREVGMFKEFDPKIYRILPQDLK